MAPLNSSTTPRSSTMDRVLRQSLSSSLPSFFRTLPASSRSRRATSRNRRSLLVSTESQTDDSVLRSASQHPVEDPASRRRRREKRRRRRASQPVSLIATQPLQQHVQQAAQLTVTPTGVAPATEVTPAICSQISNPAASDNSDDLPDILNAHLPPPYSTLPHNTERRAGMGPLLLTPPAAASSSSAAGVAIPSPVSPSGTTAAVYSLPPGGRRRSRSSLYASEESSKSCCGVSVDQTISIRWFILMIAFVGICCAVVGTVLGAMRASGREHLTVSLLMIGVGIVLITVSGIAWRLTSQDAPTCRSMLGFTPTLSTPGSAESGECPTDSGRRFMSRAPPVYGRPHHPYAAMMYSDFQYRQPPPSYQASMQEYRLRLLVMDRERQQPAAAASVSLPEPASPPPTYRSQNNTLVRPSLLQRESGPSRPPSYRAGTITSSLTETAETAHRRNLSTVVGVNTASIAVNTTDVKTAADTPSLVSELKNERPCKYNDEINTIAIVHTANSSQVVLGHDVTSAVNSPAIMQRHTLGTVVQSLQVLAQL